VLNEWGTVVREEWERSTTIRREIILDEFVIMPNHMHGIVEIKFHRSTNSPINIVGAHGRAPLQRQPKSWDHLLRDSNLLPPNASMNYVTHLAYLFGNAIIMTTSSAMRLI